MKFLPADMIMVRRLLPVLGLVALASTGLSGCANVASPISSPNSFNRRARAAASSTPAGTHTVLSCGRRASSRTTKSSPSFCKPAASRR